MLKKFGTFLIIMLAISSVLLLMATDSRKDKQPSETTESTAQTTETPTETQTPTESQAESQPETVPEATAEPTAPTVTQTAPVSQVREQTAQILDRAELVQTAVTYQVLSARMGASEQTQGLSQSSHGAALAELSGERKMNPVAAFWELVSAQLYEKQTDESGVLAAAAFEAPEQTAATYEYTAVGCRQLLTDLLALSARMEDGVDMETALLGANMVLEPSQVFHSKEEECRYAYFSCSSDRATYILCFYLRGSEVIEDVEFQLLYLRHASGDAEALTKLDEEARQQAASLMAAAELLMTGKTRAAEGQIPFAYTVGSAASSIERFTFTGTPDQGSLLNYRLRSK